jgi:hypothetical protein
MMKMVLFLFAALSFIAWPGPTPASAEELCVGPACVGDHHRDRDEGREERREHREHEGREERREEHREKDRLWR